MKQLLYPLALASVMVLLSTITGCFGSDTANPVIQDPVVYTEPLNPAFIKDVNTTCENSDGTTFECVYNIPLDQLGVMMNTGLGFERIHESLTNTLDNLGNEGIRAEIIGQIPSLNLFQVRVIQDELEADSDNPAVIQAAFDRLRRAGDVIRDSEDVFSVAFAWPMEIREGMEPDDDNSDLSFVPSDLRPGIAAIDYYQAVPIFDEVFGDARSALHHVMVGVLDTGLGLDTNQFDEIEVFNLTGSDLTDEVGGHGTMVIGLIAADNGDGGMNGIASRIINGPSGSLGANHLTIAVNRWQHTVFSYIEALHKLAALVDQGSQIINLSLGYHRYNIRILDGDHPLEGRLPSVTEFTEARRQWLQFMSGNISEATRAGEVLYICAVPNLSITLTTGSDFPAGIPLPNVITVGGIDTDDLYDRATFTASGGSQITVSAPATDIPVMYRNLNGSVNTVLEDGSSLATPMITSIAAIMYAVDGTATPEKIKQFLLDDNNSWNADPSTGGRRAALLKTVGRYILAHGSFSLAASFLDTMGQPNNNTDPSAFIMNNHISPGQSSLQVTNDTGGIEVDEIFTEAEYDTVTGVFINNSGGMLAGGFTSIQMRAGQYITSAALISGPFELRTFPITQDGVARGTMNIGLDPISGNADYSGVFISGDLTFDECELTTRSIRLDDNFLIDIAASGEDAWKFIQMRGRFNAHVEGADLTVDPPLYPVFYDVTSEFDTIFALVNIDDTTQEYLEYHCVGGYHYGEPAP